MDGVRPYRPPCSIPSSQCSGARASHPGQPGLVRWSGLLCWQWRASPPVILCEYCPVRCLGQKHSIQGMPSRLGQHNVAEVFILYSIKLTYCSVSDFRWHKRFKNYFQCNTCVNKKQEVNFPLENIKLEMTSSLAFKDGLQEMYNTGHKLYKPVLRKCKLWHHTVTQMCKDTLYISVLKPSNSVLALLSTLLWSPLLSKATLKSGSKVLNV